MLSPKICNSGVRPVALGGLGLGERVGRLETGGHGGAGSRHDLVVVDVEEPQPRLLAEREPYEAAQLDQLGLAEVGVEALPEGVVRVAGPDDRLGVGERGLLPLVIALGRLEVQQLVVLPLLEPRLAAALGALVAAVLALDAVRDVDAAQLLDGVVDNALAEQVAPGVGERPEGGRHMRANRGALRPRRPLARAALHFGPHLRRHLLQRHVADALRSGHAVLLPRDGRHRLPQPSSRIAYTDRRHRACSACPGPDLRGYFSSCAGAVGLVVSPGRPHSSSGCRSRKSATVPQPPSSSRLPMTPRSRESPSPPRGPTTITPTMMRIGAKRGTVRARMKAAPRRRKPSSVPSRAIATMMIGPALSSRRSEMSAYSRGSTP